MISADKVTNPHKLTRNPFYFIELLIDKETKCTHAVQRKGGGILWDKELMLYVPMVDHFVIEILNSSRTVTASSNLTIRMYCRHHHVRDNHIVGEASYEVLDLERNKGRC